jgi:hypothetical protein
LGQSGTSKAHYKELIIGVVVIVLILAILFVPLIPARETYNETEPFSRKATFEVVSATFTQEYGPGGGGIGNSTVTIKNTDSYGGIFSVTHFCVDAYGVRNETTEAYIAAGGTHTFTVEFDTPPYPSVATGDHSVTQPTVIDQRVAPAGGVVYKSLVDFLINR